MAKLGAERNPGAFEWTCSFCKDKPKYLSVLLNHLRQDHLVEDVEYSDDFLRMIVSGKEMKVDAIKKA